MKEGDFPWWICDFKPTKEFISVKPFFDRWYDSDPNDLDLLNENFDEFLDLQLFLLENGDNRIDEFVIGIKDNKAWYREFG